MKILENVPLKNLTTMRLGGPAKYVIEIENPDEIKAAYDFAASKNLPTFILGGGANTIAHDEGFNGVIIKNCIVGINSQERLFEGPPEPGKARMSAPRPWRRAEVTQPEKSLSDYLITAMGGTVWDDVVAFAVERNLTGIEALSKIPGLAGAAPVQNIGAYGQDISQVFESAEVYDTKDQTRKTLFAKDFNFSYRHSILNTTEKNRYFVISITLKLKVGKMPRPFYNSIERYITEHNETDFSPKNIRKIVSEIRADKLPDPAFIASAGSFFKNVYLTEDEAKVATAKNIPVYHGHDGLKINSAWLIEECGFKSALLHGIRVNEKAPLVLINESAKNYADLAAARQEIIDTVYNKFGYTLEQEPVEL